MKKNLLAFLLLTFGLCTGCAKNVVTAPVPGSTNSVDATAFRILADAQASLHSIKTWEQCSAANFPTTISIDGTVEPCDSKAGVFPPALVSYLNAALTTYNNLEAAAQAFHASGSTDGSSLEAQETQLQNDVSALFAKIGGR